MHELSPAELDVLARIDAKEELRPFFFRKAKGLKWFDALNGRGYFNPAGNSAPVPAKEEGYVSVPSWPVTDYLVATSPELLDGENRAYAKRALGIIREVTEIAKEKKFGNYRTWWQFSKIIQNIPIDLITSDDLGYVDYWLNDKYDRSLVAEELGKKWLVALLEQPNDKAKAIALDLLKSLYKATFITKTLGDSERKEAVFRFQSPVEIESVWVIALAALSIAVNGGSVLLLKRDAENNMNIKSAYLHLLTDMITSVSVLIGGICMAIWNVTWVDSLLSIIIACYLVYASWGLLLRTLSVIMQFTPSKINCEELAAEAKKVPGISNIHHLHVWSLNDKEIHLEAHIDFKKDILLSAIDDKIKQLNTIFRQKFSITHTVFQPEYRVDDSKDIIVEE